ncbi:Protein O-GlcNAc transferase [Bertholletia excelsa]
MEEPRWLFSRASLLLFTLLLPLLYTLHFGTDYVAPFESFDQRKWKEQLTDRRGTTEADQGLGDQQHLDLLLGRLVRGEDLNHSKSTGLACLSDSHTDVCIATGQVAINANTLKVYAPSGEPHNTQTKLTVRPYARKEDKFAMRFVRPFELLEGRINSNTTTPPVCNYTHNVPALIFSSGGFTGNLFHEFNEIIIPLFITSRHFRSQVAFVVSDVKPWFISKYNRILSHLSRYEVINTARNKSVHCFPGAVVGLHFHGNLALNATGIPGGYSMADFKAFLSESYGLKMERTNAGRHSSPPVLILISRQKTRVFLNEDEMVRMMEELGFRVILALPHLMSNLDKFAKVVNTASVLVGAHGAGLTNAVFLPAGAVLLQVVPLGLNWASTTYYGRPAPEMGLRYIEYKIKPEESSLLNLYNRDHPVISNPASVFSKGYLAARAVYVDGQNLNISASRFRETLMDVLKLLGRSTPLV